MATSPGVVVDLAREDAKECRLARAVLAEQTDTLAGVDLKGQSVQYFLFQIKGLLKSCYADLDHVVLSNSSTIFSKCMECDALHSRTLPSVNAALAGIDRALRVGIPCGALVRGVRDAAGVLTDSDDAVDAEQSAQLAHRAVRGLRQLAELLHVAEHGDLLALARRKHAQRRGHGLRVGVVAVVEQAAVAAEAVDAHPRAGGLIECDAALDLGDRQTQLLTDRDRERRGVDHVPPRRGDAEMIRRRARWSRCQAMPSMPRSRSAETRTSAVRALAAADDALRESYRVEQRVVAVEDGDAVGVEVFKDLALSLQNTLARA